MTRNWENTYLAGADRKENNTKEKQSEFYMVGSLATELEVMVMGKSIKVNTIWTEGMIGACPVFENKEDALEFAGEKYKVITIEAYNPKETKDE